ncbi:MAG: hypothetical protein PHX70_02820 [Clostridium sp.]|nr:hypothetical protein [Clostridium sp.]
MDITDVTKFTNILEYNIYLYSIVFMFLSEFIICTFTSIGNKKDRKSSNIW